MISIESNIIPILYYDMLDYYIFIFSYMTYSYIHHLNHDILPLFLNVQRFSEVLTHLDIFSPIKVSNVQHGHRVHPFHPFHGESSLKRYGTFLASKSGPALKGLVGPPSWKWMTKNGGKRETNQNPKKHVFLKIAKQNSYENSKR